MNKKLITAVLAMSMLASGAVVFAANETPEPEIIPWVTPAEDVNVPEEIDIPQEVAVISASYMKNEVVVTEITEDGISSTINAEDSENPENTINYTISDDTVVLGLANGDVKSLEDIKSGDTITVYTNVYSPAPLILPPQYSADVIFVYDNLEISSMRLADVDTYVADNEMLVNVSNTLALNIGEETKIVDTEGKEVSADELDKKDLAVVYSTTTRSIPPQTTPHKIVVLGENEMALAQLEAQNAEATEAPEATEEPEVTDKTSIIVEAADIKDVDGVKLVPVRKLAEGLGLEVVWNGEDKSVTVGTIPMGVSFKIGENSYSKSKMTPFVLEAAPQLINDTTFVPVSFFEEVLETMVLRFSNN